MDAQHKALATLKIDQLRPSVDGHMVRFAPISAEGLAMQAATPGILSCTRNELVPAREPANLDITFDQVKERIKSQYDVDDAKAAAAVSGYRKDDPQRTPYDVLMMAASEAYVRAPIHRLADALAGVRGSRFYLLDFNFYTDPARGAPHAYDIAYAFGNLAGGRVPLTGPGPQAVSEAMMSTFSTFARTGEPNNPRIPEWKTYDTATRSTLVMDYPPRVVNDYRRNDRLTSATLPPVEPTKVSDGPLVRVTA
jgi:para-nitrobenzyl esterase